MHDIKSCCCCCSEWFTGRSWAVLHVVSRPTVVPPFGPVLTIGSNGVRVEERGREGRAQSVLRCSCVSSVKLLPR